MAAIHSLAHRWRPETYDFNDAAESAVAALPILLPPILSCWSSVIGRVASEPGSLALMAVLLKIMTSLVALPDPPWFLEDISGGVLIGLRQLVMTAAIPELLRKRAVKVLLVAVVLHGADYPQLLGVSFEAVHSALECGGQVAASTVSGMLQLLAAAAEHTEAEHMLLQDGSAGYQVLGKIVLQHMRWGQQDTDALDMDPVGFAVAELEASSDACWDDGEEQCFVQQCSVRLAAVRLARNMGTAGWHCLGTQVTAAFSEPQNYELVSSALFMAAAVGAPSEPEFHPSAHAAAVLATEAISQGALLPTPLRLAALQALSSLASCLDPNHLLAALPALSSSLASPEPLQTVALHSATMLSSQLPAVGARAVHASSCTFQEPLLHLCQTVLTVLEHQPTNLHAARAALSTLRSLTADQLPKVAPAALTALRSAIVIAAAKPTADGLVMLVFGALRLLLDRACSAEMVHA
eukprot:TRINITY_DN19792_c0_g1_i4.p1 TRINITY_DN19792_c0_g1~~TRINITY_DN19792_c0_g1_i4.p1  ORF type:complete len:466 (+),score=124.91 TRINITY_DN19792_c0_g1_i4:285-1682(+)